MTTYGTIPPPSSSHTVANMEYASGAAERLKAALGTRRPWKEMFDFQYFNLPENVSDAVSRIKLNLDYFRMNHALVVLLIIFASLLWHPFSLIVLISMTVAWIYFYVLRDEPLIILGRTITDPTVTIGLAVATFVLLLYAGVISNISGAISVGVVVVLLHSVFRKSDNLCLDEEAAGFVNPAAAGRVPPRSTY